VRSGGARGGSVTRGFIALSGEPGPVRRDARAVAGTCMFQFQYGSTS